MGLGNGSNGGGDGDEPDNEDNCTTTNRMGGHSEDRGREFTFVKSSNIVIRTFSGKNFNINPYMPFNKSLRRFIYNQGADGERLLEVPNGVEDYGATKFDNGKLKDMVKMYPKVAEYNRAIMSLFLNYTTSFAKGMVEYGVDNDFDAWRRIYHHHVPLAEDLREIFMHEFYSFKPVTEYEIDSLFNEVERIIEF